MPPVGEIRAGPLVGVVAKTWANIVANKNNQANGVGFMLTVENYTTNTLTSHKKEENTGQDWSWYYGLEKKGFEKLYKIEPSTSGAIFGKNYSSCLEFTGSTGTVSWTIGKTNKMLVVMYSVPWDQNLYSNWLGVGIFDVGDTRASFDTMYYKSADTLFDKKEFCHNLDPFVFKGAEGFNVEAEMDASHMSKIMVKLYRR